MPDKSHIIIIGWNDFSMQVATQVLNADKRVVVISDRENPDHKTMAGFVSRGDLLFFGCGYYDFEKIKDADVEHALAVLINLETDTEKLKYVIPFNKHFGKKETVVPINNANLKETFSKAGVRYPLSKNELAGKILSGFLFEKDVAVYCKDLLSSAETDDAYDVQQFYITADSPLRNKTFGQAFRELREDFNTVLIGIEKAATSTQKATLLKNPPSQTPVNEGDYIIVILDGNSADKISQYLSVTEGVQLASKIHAGDVT